MEKKGQAALEFLITYSWALIMIFVVISAIVYFGVLKPKDILPDRCLFSPEIECIAYSLSSSDNTFKLKIKNNVGSMITVTTLDLSKDGSTNLDCAENPQKPTNWPHTSSKELIFADCNFEAAGFYPGKTAKLFLHISFYPLKGGSSYVRNVQGEIITKVS